MNTKQIAELLTTNENELFSLYNNQPASFWEKQPQGKWTAGQHLIHLIQSTRPLLLGLSIPTFVLKWVYGTSNRPSRTLEEVISRYKEKLAMIPDGVVSPFSRRMPNLPINQMPKLQAKFARLNNTLNKKISKYTDKDLDTVIIGHPLMGKMTLREMLMWNAYHTKHHELVLREKYL
jgi:hypothetical protein